MGNYNIIVELFWEQRWQPFATANENMNRKPLHSKTKIALCACATNMKCFKLSTIEEILTC